MSNPKQKSQKRNAEERKVSPEEAEFDHLSDGVDQKESAKKALKNGLLSFLKHTETKGK